MTRGTNPEVQTSSKPNFGSALSASSGQPQVAPKARSQSRLFLSPRPASPGSCPRRRAVSECPATGGQGAPGRKCSPLWEATVLRWANPASAPGRSLPAPPAKPLLRSTHSRVQPVTRAPQAPQTRCRTRSKHLAPSAGPYGFLRPARAPAGADHRTISPPIPSFQDFDPACPCPCP